MRRRTNRSCTYAVALDSDAGSGEVQALARHLSTLNRSDCEVLVVDGSPSDVFDEHHRLLRWVSHHHAVLPHCRFLDGRVDLVQSATELATTEKVIIAVNDSRCTAEEVRAVCELLDCHDVVEPEEYFEPLPWWGGVDAGRVLLHRGVDRLPHGRATLAFRRAAFLQIRDVPDRTGRNETRRLALQGAEVHEARGVFVRREPGSFGTWLRLRPREASAELIAPMKTLFFLAIVPLIVLLAILGGARVAAGCAGKLAVGSVMVALRGRIGAGKFFPVRACLFAPLWIVERSLSVYWALFDRLRGATVHAVTPSPLRTRESVASGE
jgi:hypothetical protein